MAMNDVQRLQMDLQSTKGQLELLIADRFAELERKLSEISPGNGQSCLVSREVEELMPAEEIAGDERMSDLVVPHCSYHKVLGTDSESGGPSETSTRR
eukprot:2955703-Amphidinium_carterae.1